MVLLLSSALRLSAAEKTMMMQSFSEAQQKDKTSKYRRCSPYFFLHMFLGVPAATVGGTGTPWHTRGNATDSDPFGLPYAAVKVELFATFLTKSWTFLLWAGVGGQNAGDPRGTACNRKRVNARSWEKILKRPLTWQKQSRASQTYGNNSQSSLKKFWKS